MDKKRIVHMEEAARMLKAVAHPARLMIIQLLQENRHLTVGQMSAMMKLTQSMTSQHLTALKNSGIVNYQKKANECHYFLLNRNVLKLMDCVNHCCRSNED